MSKLPILTLRQRLQIIKPKAMPISVVNKSARISGA
jgi:hypothetical protein